MIRFVKIAAALFLLGISFSENSWAADAAPANPYSGDFWTRSTLSGDWGGLRNDLATKGVTIDLSLTQAAQGIVHGGKDTGWQYSGGRGDIILNVDTQKLGLWPGGFLNVEAEGNFIPADTLRKSINGKTGALMPVNSSQIYPTPAGGNFNLPALNFTQFLSPYFDNRQVRHFDKQWRRVVRKEVCTAMIKGLTPAEVRAIAKEAYVYGNPMVDNYRIQYAYFVDPKPEYKAPFNKLVNVARVYTPEDKATQTPNSDTPHSLDASKHHYTLRFEPGQAPSGQLVLVGDDERSAGEPTGVQSH